MSQSLIRFLHFISIDLSSFIPLHTKRQDNADQNSSPKASFDPLRDAISDLRNDFCTTFWGRSYDCIRFIRMHQTFEKKNVENLSFEYRTQRNETFNAVLQDGDALH